MWYHASKKIAPCKHPFWKHLDILPPPPPLLPTHDWPFLGYCPCPCYVRDGHPGCKATADRREMERDQTGHDSELSWEHESRSHDDTDSLFPISQKQINGTLQGSYRIGDRLGWLFRLRMTCKTLGMLPFLCRRRV
jgi:hypothetical protein